MTSAEQRAKELLASLLEVRWPSEAEVIPLIAQVITQAENDKLEEAAACAAGASLRAHDDRYDRAGTAIAVASAVRSLKKD